MPFQIQISHEFLKVYSFLQFDRRKTKSNSPWKLKCIILAVQDLSETRQSQKQDNNTDPWENRPIFYSPCLFCNHKKIVPIAKCKINFCTMFAFMVPLLCNLRCYLLFNAVVTKKTAKIFEGLRTYQRAFECTPRRPNFVIVKSFVRRSLEVFVLLCASSTETFKK